MMVSNLKFESESVIFYISTEHIILIVHCFLKKFQIKKSILVIENRVDDIDGKADDL